MRRHDAQRFTSTRRAGRFVLEGLKPGRYELRVSGEPYERLEFEIPPKARGLYDLGTLKLASLEPH
jgi:hypothetical protein